MKWPKHVGEDPLKHRNRVLQNLRDDRIKALVPSRVDVVDVRGRMRYPSITVHNETGGQPLEVFRCESRVTIRKFWGHQNSAGGGRTRNFAHCAPVDNRIQRRVDEVEHETTGVPVLLRIGDGFERDQGREQFLSQKTWDKLVRFPDALCWADLKLDICYWYYGDWGKSYLCPSFRIAQSCVPLKLLEDVLDLEVLK